MTSPVRSVHKSSLILVKLVLIWLPKSMSAYLG